MILVCSKNAVSCHPYHIPARRSLKGNYNNMLRGFLNCLIAGFFFLISLCVADVCFAADVKLGWSANKEPNVKGYGVYFRKGSPGPPFYLFGYVTTKELKNPAAPTFTAYGLVKGARYYFAVSAYDTSGKESLISNMICVDVGNVNKLCPQR